MDKIKNRQTQPFFMIPNTLIDDGHLARMGTASAMVYLCLCRHANTEHQCFPSYSKLQEETGMARSTTSIAIANLLELGYVRKLELKRGMANIYEIMEFPQLASTEIELVQKTNQYENRTTTSTEIEPLLVRKSDSKNTKGKRPIEKDSLREGTPEKNLTEVADEKPVTRRVQKFDPFIHGRTSALERQKAIAANNISAFKSPEEKTAFGEWAKGELGREYSPAMALDKAGWAVRNLDQNKQDDLLAADLLKRYRANLAQSGQGSRVNELVDELIAIAKSNPSEAQKRANELENSKGLPVNFYWNKVLGAL